MWFKILSVVELEDFKDGPIVTLRVHEEHLSSVIRTLMDNGQKYFRISEYAS